MVSKETLEDKECTSEACRLEKFGQEDHIRKVGRDLIELIGKYFEQVHTGRIHEWYQRKHPELGRLFKNPEFRNESPERFIIAVKGDTDVARAATTVLE